MASPNIVCDEELVEKLLETTRARIAAGDRDNALAALINAICLTRGEDKVLETLQAAKEREERRVTTEAHNNRRLRQSIDEALAASKKLVEAPSLLQDLGDEDLLRQAFEDGSSVICQRCNGLVPFARWGAHCELWCPAIDNGEDSS